MPSNPSLADHARRRHEQTLQRARSALERLATRSGPVSVARLTREAAVSRSWIYSQPELLDLLEKLRHTNASAARHSADSRASEESLRRRLNLAHQHVTQLRNDNHELREMLAHAHGELRAAKAQQNL